MGLRNQWKIISLETDAQSAYRSGNWEVCYKKAVEGLERLGDESHSSFPLNWEYYEKLVKLRNDASAQMNKYGW